MTIESAQGTIRGGLSATNVQSGFKDVTIRLNLGLALWEVKITSSGKDLKGIASMISQLLGEDSRVQKIMM